MGYSLLGMFVAVLTRSAPAAVGVCLAYALVVESLLASLVPDQAQWLPGQVSTALTSSSATISYWQALAERWPGGPLRWLLEGRYSGFAT